MNDLSIFPADIAEMSVTQLANLPAKQLVEVDTNLDQAIAWLKAARTKLDGALDQRFGAQGRDSLHASGRDFGTSHVKTEGLHVKFDLPKKVSWDQKKLKTIAERIVASGGRQVAGQQHRGRCRSHGQVRSPPCLHYRGVGR